MRLTVTLFHSKQRANEQKVTSNEQKVMSNEQKINEQRAENNEQRAKSNKQRATSNEQKVQPHFLRYAQVENQKAVKLFAYEYENIKYCLLFKKR